MVKSHEIKAAWDRREAKRLARRVLPEKPPSALLRSLNTGGFDSYRSHYADLLDEIVGKFGRVDERGPLTMIKMPSTSLASAFKVDPSTGITGMRADLVVWDEVAAVEESAVEALESVNPFDVFNFEVSRISKAATTSMNEALSKTKEAFKGWAHGELMVMGGGRMTGKSAFIDQYAGIRKPSFAFPAAAVVMTPEQIALNRARAEQTEIEQIIIESEREQLGYGGW